jgi:hypothetical protein
MLDEMNNNTIGFSRAWAMPRSDTFHITPINGLIQSCIDKFSRQRHRFFVDPFVHKSPFKNLCYSNDLDPSIKADKHLDALDFLKSIGSNSVDLLLFDPPYSPRQISENYKKCKKAVNMQTTQSKFWGDLKKQISRIMKSGSIVITCGWNSGGVGRVHGFQIQEILMVAHGSWHNDTIVTVEKCVARKISSKRLLTKVRRVTVPSVGRSSRRHSEMRRSKKRGRQPKHHYELRSQDGTRPRKKVQH